MTEHEAKELAELRAFLEVRGLTVRVCEKEGDTMGVEVPANQEALFREAMAAWQETHLSVFKRWTGRLPGRSPGAGGPERPIRPV